MESASTVPWRPQAILLKNIAFLVTQDAQRAILQDTDLLLENGSITKIGEDLIAPSGHCDIIDCRHKTVMPGLINCHTHIGMTTLRGVSDDEQLTEWLGKVIPAEQALTPAEIKEGCEIACQEMISSGTTTFADMYWPAEPSIEAARSSGLRAIIFPTLFEAFSAGTDRLDEALAILEKHRSIKPGANGQRVRIGIGAHSIYGCAKETLNKISAFSARHDLPVAIHLSETRKERSDCIASNGKLPADYLAETGLLTPRTLLVHCVWLTKGEIGVIQRSGAHAAHCPVSNMKLASGGVMPLPELASAGVSIGLGTDSTVSNNNLDMFEEMKVCGLLHKHHRWDARAAPVQQIIDMATIDGARCLGLDKEIGSIEIGKKADIITIDLQEAHMRPVRNILSTIVYAASGDDVSDVIVDGNILLRDKISRA